MFALELWNSANAFTVVSDVPIFSNDVPIQSGMVSVNCLLPVCRETPFETNGDWGLLMQEGIIFYNSNLDKEAVWTREKYYP